MPKIAIAKRIPPSGPFEERGAAPCVEQVGFDNVREPVTLNAPTSPLPLPFLPRDPTKTATPVQVVLSDFEPGNVVTVRWLINGHYASEQSGQVLFSAPVFQAGESLTPGRVAVASPGTYASAADATLINNPFVKAAANLNINVVMHSPFVVVRVDQAALDTLGVTKDAPLVCRLLAVNGGPEPLRVGLDLTEITEVGGGSLWVEEPGCFDGPTPTKLTFPPVGGPLGQLPGAT